MSEIIMPFAPQEVYIPTDYKDLCIELRLWAEQFQYKPDSKRHTDETRKLAEILNRSYDVRGAAVVESEFAYEIAHFPPERTPNPIERHDNDRVISELKDFQLAAFCLGFSAECVPGSYSQIYLEFTDKDDPLLVAGNKLAPEVVKRFAVPITSQHQIAVSKGYTFEELKLSA